MRLYLATAAADDILWATEAGLIDGVVATPAVLAAELPHADPGEVLAELAEHVDPRQVERVEAGEAHLRHEFCDRRGRCGHQRVEGAVVAHGEIDVHAPAGDFVQQVVVDPRSPTGEA